MEFTNERWKAMKRTSTGTVMTLAHAMSWPHETLSCRKQSMPTIAGRTASLWVTISGQRYWFQAGRKVRIATVAIAGPDNGMMPEVSVTLQDRFAGIHEELAAAGTGVVAAADKTSWSDPEHGYRATRRLLAGGTRLRALVAMNDNLAFGAYRALREAGLSVPEDVSVVSFDDDVIASYVRPALTTASIPYEEMGRTAMRMALDGEVEPQTVLVPMPVQHRDSVVSP